MRWWRSLDGRHRRLHRRLSSLYVVEHVYGELAVAPVFRLLAHYLREHFLCARPIALRVSGASRLKERGKLAWGELCLRGRRGSGLCVRLRYTLG